MLIGIPGGNRVSGAGVRSQSGSLTLGTGGRRLRERGGVGEAGRAHQLTDLYGADICAVAKDACPAPLIDERADQVGRGIDRRALR